MCLNKEQKAKNLGFFSQEMKLGRIRLSDPALVAQTLLGTLFIYVFSQQISKPTKQAIDVSNVSTYVGQIVEIIWQGLAPTQCPKAEVKSLDFVPPSDT